MIFPATEENVEKAAKIIRAGGCVAFPTETVYGLGADAFNPSACARIFEIKNRPFFDPLIVHVSGISEIEKVADFKNPKAKKLAEKFWPGPMTLILPKKPAVPLIVSAGMETVAVRVPKHKTALELIKKSGVPIAAPSANPFSFLSPTSAEHVEKQLGDKVEMILDGGVCEFGVESTIIDFSEEFPRILRFGGLEIEKIEKTIGKLKTEENSREKQKAPGQFKKHYAPKTKLKIIDFKTQAFDFGKGGKIGLLAFKKPQSPERFTAVEVLSETGDLKQAASRLFESWHRLDAENLDIIYAEAVPESGLGRAIMDRLKRAEGIK